MIHASNISKLNDAALAAGLSQVVWAKRANVNRSRLSLAINGHLELNEKEISAVKDALREVLAERVSAFNKILGSNLSLVAV